MRNKLPLPLSWGDDALTDFLDFSRTNQLARFANKKPEAKKIIDIDKVFCRVIHVLKEDPPNLEPPFRLLFRAHTTYRATANIAFSGYSTELYPLLRSMLEQGGYAFLMHIKPELIEVWQGRQESNINRAAVPRAFAVGKIRDTLASLNSNLDIVFKKLYEKTIDFGAHPNELSITSGMRIEAENDQQYLKLIYLHRDGIVLNHSLFSLAQVGIFVLLIFREVFREQFELAGVSSELRKLWESLSP